MIGLTFAVLFGLIWIAMNVGDVAAAIRETQRHE